MLVGVKGRRRTVAFLAVTTACVVLLAGCGFAPATETVSGGYSVTGDTVYVRLTLAPDLAQIGGSISIVDDRLPRPMIIARVGAEEYVVASNHCTHNSKPLGYDPEGGVFRCASGKSEFAVDGRVLRGPAEQDLMIYPWSLQDGTLVIDRNEPVP
jgi:cytochrome b6-f complex iron-sulfur subunit